jgi:hypothetical protein
MLTYALGFWQIDISAARVFYTCPARMIDHLWTVMNPTWHRRKSHSALVVLLIRICPAVRPNLTINLISYQHDPDAMDESMRRGQELVVAVLVVMVSICGTEVVVQGFLRSLANSSDASAE